MADTPRRSVLKRIGLTSATLATIGSGSVAARPNAERATTPSPPEQANARVRGRIDPLGHDLPHGAPMYTFGHTSADGQWGVIGSWPRSGSDVASTLFDLSDLENPEAVHELEMANALTRTNDVKFDRVRDGLYYRSQEADGDDGQEGIEVVDFGWEEGTPEEPAVLAQLSTPRYGVHKLTEHHTEPILYLVDLANNEYGVIVVDVSEPHDPKIVNQVGPAGGLHDVEYDPVREVLHGAYISGPSEGYVVYDASDPVDLEVLGHFEYADQPDYEEIGTPGFESCHQAHYDPERDFAIVGDEIGFGMPGGKHVFDIGWDEGSLEDPQPIGFTHSPDAREMDGSEQFWWTTHFHDVVHDGDEVLLVDGGYRNGTWVANITDPTDPTPTERYGTTEAADRAQDHSGETPMPATPPFAWGAWHNEERDFVFVSDSITGAYTFDLSARPARGEDGRGPGDFYDLEAALEDDPEEEGGDHH
jgi:hypothetical protein